MNCFETIILNLMPDCNKSHFTVIYYVLSLAAADLDAQITAQGNKIRDLKSQKAAKDVIDTAVKSLLALKAEFKRVVGKDWDPKGLNTFLLKFTSSDTVLYTT